MNRLRILTSQVAGSTAFAGWYTVQLLRSSGALLADILRPAPTATPRVVRHELADRSAARVATLGALITLTPGTLALGVTDGGRALLVHSMYHADADAARAELRHLEERMLDALSAPRTGSSR